MFFNELTRSSGRSNGVIRRDFLKIGSTLLGGLACTGFSGPAATAAEKTAPAGGCQLRDGDVLALCGDSITSDGHYPSFLEAYQLLCGPTMKVTFVNCGRWGEIAWGFPKTWDKDFLPARPTVLTVCYGMNIGRGGRPFNADLNRLTLVVRGARAKKLTVTWGGQAKEFEAEALEKGINLAAEFLDKPFVGPFGKIMVALSERNSCRKWLTQEAYKNDPSIPRRLEAALKTLVPVPVKHEIKVEAAS